MQFLLESTAQQLGEARVGHCMLRAGRLDHVSSKGPGRTSLGQKRVRQHRKLKLQPRCQAAPVNHREAAFLGRVMRPHLPTIARILRPLVRQLSVVLRRAFQALKPIGKGNLVFVVIGFFGAGIAAFRKELVAKVRSCRDCTGFGIQRCPLCSGKGMVGWEGKWNHREPCPSCLGRRYVECMSCGGRFHRPLFQHTCTNADTLLRDLEKNTLDLGTA